MLGQEYPAGGLCEAKSTPQRLVLSQEYSVIFVISVIFVTLVGVAFFFNIAQIKLIGDLPAAAKQQKPQFCNPICQLVKAQFNSPDLPDCQAQFSSPNSPASASANREANEARHRISDDFQRPAVRGRKHKQ